MTSKLNDNLSFLACHIHSAILVVVKGKNWIVLDIKLLFGAKREACAERESSVQVYIVLPISSKTNYHLFSHQNCRRAMGYNLVKVLILKRVICERDTRE